jgi:hypothetical protein
MMTAAEMTDAEVADQIERADRFIAWSGRPDSRIASRISRFVRSQKSFILTELAICSRLTFLVSSSLRQQNQPYERRVCRAALGGPSSCRARFDVRSRH